MHGGWCKWQPAQQALPVVQADSASQHQDQSALSIGGLHVALQIGGRRAQSQLQTLPGRLAFWIQPRTGELSKWDNGKGVLTRVSDGSSVAKILYVLIPNWQLFWLSDAVSPEEKELKALRHDLRYTKGRVPWKYVFTSLVYVVLFVGLVLSLALWMFENRELN